MVNILLPIFFSIFTVCEAPQAYPDLLNITDPSKEVVQESGEAGNIQSKGEVKDGSSEATDVNNNYKETQILQNESFLRKVHQTLFDANNNKHSYPNNSKATTLPSSIPTYGKNLVYHKPSDLLGRRNLPNMSISIGNKMDMTAISSQTGINMPALHVLRDFLNNAETSVKLYETQLIKFQDNVSCINKGTEPFYPNEAKPLLESYIKTIPELITEQKRLANSLIDEIQKKDPSFNKPKYKVD